MGCMARNLPESAGRFRCCRQFTVALSSENWERKLSTYLFAYRHSRHVFLSGSKFDSIIARLWNTRKSIARRSRGVRRRCLRSVQCFWLMLLRQYSRKAYQRPSILRILSSLPMVSYGQFLPRKTPVRWRHCCAFPSTSEVLGFRLMPHWFSEN